VESIVHPLCLDRESQVGDSDCYSNAECSSTRNTRIERLWVDIGKEFGRRWRGFFNRLEDQYSLDPKNPAHLWLLTELFLGMINEDCERFVVDYNHKGIKNKDVGNMCPNVSITVFEPTF
jgi:hypothetical protein